MHSQRLLSAVQHGVGKWSGHHARAVKLAAGLGANRITGIPRCANSQRRGLLVRQGLSHRALRSWISVV